MAVDIQTIAFYFSDQTFLPCEFCGEAFPFDMLVLHQVYDVYIFSILYNIFNILSKCSNQKCIVYRNQCHR